VHRCYDVRPELVSDEVFATVEARLATPARGSDEWEGDGTEPGALSLAVQALPGGGAVVVFGVG
jgi:hypothetical protein